MMNDWLYTEVYKKCLNAGAKDTIARNSAQKLVDDYKKSRLKKKLKDAVNDAVKQSVKDTKRYK